MKIRANLRTNVCLTREFIAFGWICRMIIYVIRRDFCRTEDDDVASDLCRIDQLTELWAKCRVRC